MRLSREEIEKRIPHRGTMCLLDEVLDWDPETIHCRSGTHTAPGHPLQNPGGLPAVSGIEYAAQAMAVHSALIRPEMAAPVSGFLAALKDVRLGASWLNDLAPDLDIRARLLMESPGGVIYQFQVLSGERELLSGRATIIFSGKPNP